MNQIFAALIFLCLLVNGAKASWIYESKESAFDSNTLHMIVAESGRYGFGVRCRTGEIQAMFLTPDRSFDAESRAGFNSALPKLLVRVDNNDPMSLDGSIVDSDGAAVMFADVDRELVIQIRDASDRIAVAISALGETFHETDFNTRGSTKAAKAMISECGALAGGDEAERFAKFWGYVLAVEDKCEPYTVETDAVMGSHLTTEDYASAKSKVADMRSLYHRRVELIGCEKASIEAAELSDLQYSEIWSAKD